MVPPGSPVWGFALTEWTEPSSERRAAQASRNAYSRSSAAASPQGRRPSTLTVPTPSRREICHSSRPAAQASPVVAAQIENATKTAASLTLADYTCDAISARGHLRRSRHLTGRGGSVISPSGGKEEAQQEAAPAARRVHRFLDPNGDGS